MTVADVLNDTRVTELDLTRHVIALTTDTVTDAIERMSAARYSSAFVSDDGTLRGIFTQRDVLTRVIGESGAGELPITAVMTSSPRTIGPERSVADALAVMNELWVRSVPVVDPDGTIRGNVSFYVLMQLIARLLSDHALRTPHEVSASHGLEFVDLTGLKTAPLVAVHEEDTLATAVDLMKTRAVGSVFVVDSRDHLLGVITEFDLQTKGAWHVDDLTARRATEFMTPDPVSLSARSSIADAIQGMADTGFSDVPLLGESGRSTAVASFRDVANYFETTIDVLE